MEFQIYLVILATFLQVTHTIFQYLIHVSQGSGGDADPLIRGFSFNNNQ